MTAPSPATAVPVPSVRSALAAPILAVAVGLGVMTLVNLATQPSEQAIDALGVERPWLDPAWLADDVVGPALLLGAALLLLAPLVVGGPVDRRLLVLGATLVLLAMGDTVDAHWVASDPGAEVAGVTSIAGKTLAATVLVAAVAVALPAFAGAARAALVTATFMLVTAYLVLSSTALDLRGRAFHVFEEGYEAAAALVVLSAVAVAVARRPTGPSSGR